MAGCRLPRSVHAVIGRGLPSLVLCILLSCVATTGAPAAWGTVRIQSAYRDPVDIYGVVAGQPRKLGEVGPFRTMVLRVPDCYLEPGFAIEVCTKAHRSCFRTNAYVGELASPEVIIYASFGGCLHG